MVGDIAQGLNKSQDDGGGFSLRPSNSIKRSSQLQSSARKHSADGVGWVHTSTGKPNWVKGPTKRLRRPQSRPDSRPASMAA